MSDDTDSEDELSIPINPIARPSYPNNLKVLEAMHQNKIPVIAGVDAFKLFKDHLQSDDDPNCNPFCAVGCKESKKDGEHWICAMRKREMHKVLFGSDSDSDSDEEEK